MRNYGVVTPRGASKLNYWSSQWCSPIKHISGWRKWWYILSYTKLATSHGIRGKDRLGKLVHSFCYNYYVIFFWEIIPSTIWFISIYCNLIFMLSEWIKHAANESGYKVCPSKRINFVKIGLRFWLTGHFIVSFAFFNFAI